MALDLLAVQCFLHLEGVAGVSVCSELPGPADLLRDLTRGQRLTVTRIRLLTYGVQLRSYFGRFFPELLGPAVVSTAPSAGPALRRADPWIKQVSLDFVLANKVHATEHGKYTLASLLNGDWGRAVASPNKGPLDQYLAPHRLSGLSRRFVLHRPGAAGPRCRGV